MFSTNTCSYNEDKKKRNPGVILVPEEGQGIPEVFLMEVIWPTS